MQITAYMSFNEIYILVINFTYPPNFNISGYYFQNNYTNSTDVYGKPLPERIILTYKIAKIDANLHGFKIYNATCGR